MIYEELREEGKENGLRRGGTETKSLENALIEQDTGTNLALMLL